MGWLGRGMKGSTEGTLAKTHIDWTQPSMSSNQSLIRKLYKHPSDGTDTDRKRPELYGK